MEVTRIIDLSPERSGEAIRSNRISRGQKSAIHGVHTRDFRFRYLIAFKNLLRSIESLGIASVEGINYFGRGLLSGDNYINYVRHEALGRDLLTVALTYVPSLKKFYDELTRTMPEYDKIKAR